MQLFALTAVAAFSATVSASSQTNFNHTYQADVAGARIYNRCSYTVYAWSIATDSTEDCNDAQPAVIPPGGFYGESYRTTESGGISIKLGKDKQCQAGSITQLEYHIGTNPLYDFNSLDVSYVDCGNEDCPTRTDGYYLKSGNNGNKLFATAGDGSICPILSCYDSASCAKCSYINPDDVQTKTCNNGADLDFYMCGGEAPGEESSTPAASSSQQAASSYQAPSSQYVPKSSSTPKLVETPSAYSEYANVAAAAVTSAPVAQNPHVVKTEVVYETVYVKRHAHGRRHQHFHA